MIQRFADRFWSFFDTAASWKIYAAMVLSTILLRIHTVFIDFMHVDVLTTYLIVKTDLAGRVFSINKGPLYHFLMKFSVVNMWDSPAAFHLTGVLFIVATGLCIVLLGYLLFNLKTGLLAGTLYGCIISSFNHSFTATNGEVIYNLFFMLSFIFFYLAVYKKKFIYLIPLGLALYASYMVKFQGIYISGILLFYTLFVFPHYLIKDLRRRLFYYGSIFLCVFIAAVFVFIDWNYTGIIINGSFKGKLIYNYSYVAAKGFSPIVLFSKLLLRVWLFGLYHSIIWIPAIIGIIRFFRRKETSDNYNYIVWISLLLFATAFTGGVRLYNHYFIPALPALAILASKEIFRMIESAVNRKRLLLVFVIPVFFWFGWNMRDLVILKFKPEWKHSEGHGMYLFRSVFINSLGEYLLPQQTLMPAIDYLRQTPEGSTILVWPMGTEVGYHSMRQSSVTGYWFNEKACYALVEREKGNDSVIHQVENELINQIKATTPDYFVDTSGTIMVRKSLVHRKKTDPPYYLDLKSIPIIRFGSYGNLADFPRIIEYLDLQYSFEGKFGESKIWKKRR